MPFRSDYEALRARLDEAERALARSSASDHEPQLRALRHQVEQLEARLADERREAGALAARLDELLDRIAPKRPAPPARAPEVSPTYPTGWVLSLAATAMLGVLAAVLVAPREHAPTERALPFDVHRMDPIAELPRVLARAPEGARLTSIEIQYATVDGVVDLDAPSYESFVRYELFSSEPAPAGPTPPPGVPQPAPRETFHTIRVTRDGLDADSSTFPFAISAAPPPTALPRCDARRAIGMAYPEGLPVGAVLVVRYDARGWEVRFASDPARRVDDETCATGTHE